jgi:hypothetical protein
LIRFVRNWVLPHKTIQRQMQSAAHYLRTFATASLIFPSEIGIYARPHPGPLPRKRENRSARFPRCHAPIYRVSCRNRQSGDSGEGPKIIQYRTVAHPLPGPDSESGFQSKGRGLSRRSEAETDAGERQNRLFILPHGANTLRCGMISSTNL